MKSNNKDMKTFKERYDSVKHYSIEWLLKDIDENKQKHEYVYFWKPLKTETISKSCLGQWYPSEFDYDGVHYYFAEQFMMACKAKLFGDEEIYKQIIESETPDVMRKLGRLVKNFDSAVWEEYKDAFVFEGNVAKFTQNKEMRKFLVETGDKVLVEASKFDQIWGIKMEESDKKVNNPHNWKGENHLGFTLMSVRDYLLVN